LSDEFDIKIRNPRGFESGLPFWVFKRLKKLRLLDRDPATGMRAEKPGHPSFIIK
jgi:hypothetical protein